MNQFRNRIVRVFIASLFLLIGIGVAVAQNSASVRFVHVIPNSTPIDVYVDGALVATQLGYGDATGYITISAGDHAVATTPAGTSTVLWEQTVSTADQPLTLIASSAEAGQFNQYADNLTTTAVGGTRLLLVHALAGAPNVDVQLAEAVELNGVTQEAGTVIASDLGYGASFGAFDLPAQTYTVNVLPTGGSGFDTLLGAVALPLSSGTSYMALVYGTANNPHAMLLSAPTNATADNGLVRFVHGAVGLPAVDVYANGLLIVPQLDTDNPTQHIALPVGEHNIEVTGAGDGDAVVSGSLEIAPGTAQTVVVLADSLGVFADDVSGIDEGSAVASVINTITDSTVSISLSNGTSLAASVGYGESSGSTSFDATVAGLDFTLTLGSDSGTLTEPESAFYGGVYYNLIVLDGSAFSAPSVLVIPTSLRQTASSAPVQGVALSSSQPQPATNSDTQVVAQPTAAPQQVFTQDEDIVTAEIVLDPSANLHLRQYPRTDALSLGLAPSGTILIVDGREGAPVALVEGQDPPPEAADWVDPASLLADEDEDLDPTLTWLNVVYATPDGGEIDAWVLAQFLIVRNEDGELQRLAELPMVPNNIAGEAVDTELTPPPIPEDIVTASVINLNPDARLNLRRTPTIEGEVLARLAPGTVVEFVGFIDDEEFDVETVEWAFISYTSPEGGVITGWASTLFLDYQWNGEKTDPAELIERGLIEPADPETIGRIGPGASPAAVPTADPLEDAYVAEVILNADARLQFRRSPDAQSESLNLIPSGTRVIVDARTDDSAWLRTTYEGEVGWIAAQYVSVTFNGDLVELIEIPVDTTLDAATDSEEGTNSGG